MIHKPALKTLLLAAGLLGVLSYGTTASAGPDPMYNFSFNIDGDTGYGSLNTQDNSANTPGSVWATSGSLTVTASSVSAEVGTYSLVPSNAPTSGPGLTNTANNQISYDNLLYPSSNPLLDGGGGVLFAGGNFDIWLTGNGPNDYTFIGCNTTGGDSSKCNTGNFDNSDESMSSTFSLTAVPEPATLALLGGSLLGFGVFRRRRKS